MKNIVLYASVTGNTKKLALAIARNLNCEARDMQTCSLKDLKDFRYIIFGFYIDKGFMSLEVEKIASEIRNKKMGIFFTLGEDPKSERVVALKERIEEFFVSNDNEVLELFCAQGAISQELIEQVRQKALAEGTPITPEREALWERAKSHPDENDVLNAVKAFMKFK
ncbi:hypothetical protein BKH43_04515 [Helicobacter sp. 13S00401-1]|uniref:flavodoxin family protein n=1 Tax=Helicobacter sp. 13S00401-1 TaxID=1905758 RepID=UPI000BA52681|nr:flavodoxin family protein [Helicobacter sp. 13S00401-1]PAF50360.1 hypothetical protein BKH43_04515 [Helicobacter sp. 13S00401-1]